MLALQMWHDLIDDTVAGLDLNLSKDIRLCARILNARNLFRSQMRKFNSLNSTEFVLPTGAYGSVLAFADASVPPLSARRPASSLFRRMAREKEEVADLRGADYVTRFERYPDRPGRLTMLAHYRHRPRLMTFFWIGPGAQIDPSIDRYRAATADFKDFLEVDRTAER